MTIAILKKKKAAANNAYNGNKPYAGLLRVCGDVSSNSLNGTALRVGLFFERLRKKVQLPTNGYTLILAKRIERRISLRYSQLKKEKKEKGF